MWQAAIGQWPNQTMLCDDVARPQYHKARLGTHSSGGAHSLLSLQQQGRLLLIRGTAYEKEIAALRQQATQIDDLKAEMAELRERLRQNSQNSSKPPSSDPPSQRTKSTSEPTGRKRGGQFGHPGHGRQLKPKEEVNQIVELQCASNPYTAYKQREG